MGYGGDGSRTFPQFIESVTYRFHERKKVLKVLFCRIYRTRIVHRLFFLSAWMGTRRRLLESIRRLGRCIANLRQNALQLLHGASLSASQYPCPVADTLVH